MHPHMDGVQDTNKIMYVRMLGYEWPSTQVKTWAYREGTRCLQHRIVRNGAGLKTCLQHLQPSMSHPQPLM